MNEAMEPKQKQQLPSSEEEEWRSVFKEGISLVLLTWSPLQLAVESKSCGLGTRRYVDGMVYDIFGWFTSCYDGDPKSIPIDGLEDLLNCLMLIFGVYEIQDGSDKEVAQTLMSMYYECMNGDYSSVIKLRETRTQSNMKPKQQQQLSKESKSVFTEGISLVLSKWPSMQQPLQNECVCFIGNYRMAFEILGWFQYFDKAGVFTDNGGSQFDPSLPVDVLKCLLEAYRSQFVTLNHDVGEEEVAYMLISMHDECMKGDYSSVIKLREAGPPVLAHQPIGQAANDSIDLLTRTTTMVPELVIANAPESG